MLTFNFNPASRLTANKVPYALGGGRLGDSGISYDSGGHITVVPAAGSLLVKKAAGGVGDLMYFGNVSSGNWGKIAIATAGVEAPLSLLSAPGSALALGANDVERMRISTAGDVLIGKTSTTANGGIQQVSHSAFTGGHAFGSEATGGETIWRAAASVLRMGGQMQMSTLGLKGTGGYEAGVTSEGPNVVAFFGTLGDAYAIAKANKFWSSTPVAGWGAAPTGGVRRSLTAGSSQSDHNDALRQLIADLHADGALASHHLIGT